MSTEFIKMRDIEPDAEMCFLTNQELCRNMHLFYNVNQEMKACPSFFYKNPSEVERIIELYKNMNYDYSLPEEILYFKIEEIESNGKKIAQLIQNEKDADAFSSRTVEKIRKIIQVQQLREEQRKKKELENMFEKNNFEDESGIIKPIISNEPNAQGESIVMIHPQLIELALKKK